MYLPSHHTLTDRAPALEVMRRHPFALLASNGADGEPFITHAPLATDTRGDAIVLTGHIARANPQTALLALEPRVLTVFSGPNAYVSPARYTIRESVPTWNYIAVHAYGDVRLLDDHAAKDRAQKRLIADHDPDYAEQWRSLDPGFQRQLLDAITVFEIDVVRLESKFKLSQNRPPEDRSRVAAHQRAGSADEQALADWMARLGIT